MTGTGQKLDASREGPGVLYAGRALLLKATSLVWTEKLLSLAGPNARWSSDQSAVASLPAIDPTDGRGELMSTAQAKALSLLNHNATDGFVGFDKTASWTFDPTNRAVPGKFDFVGVAEHEISEVLGRMADFGAIAGTIDHSICSATPLRKHAR
jgi:hypothetical protein